MARVSATKVRQLVVVTGAALPNGFTPETVAFYNPDGTAFDFSEVGIVLPPVPAFHGAWQTDTAYPAQAIVRHDDALYITQDGAAQDVEPGAVIESTADSPGGSAPAGTYNRLAPGTNSDVPYVDGHALVFFDLIAGGLLSIDYDIGAGNQFGTLYDDAGAEVAAAGGLGAPLDVYTSVTGRYFADIQHAFGGDGEGDMTFTLSEGAEVTGDVPSWEFMLQGVTP